MARLDAYINPETGDYELSNGNILNKNAILNAIYLRIKTPKNSFKWNKNIGTQYISEMLNIRSNLNYTLFINDIYTALQPMVNNGIISNLKVNIITTSTRPQIVIDALDVINNTLESLIIWN